MRYEHKAETHDLRETPKTKQNHRALGQEDSNVDQEYTNQITKLSSIQISENMTILKRRQRSHNDST